MIRWEVRKKQDGTVLGVVTERRWFDAREEACQRYGVDRGDIEVIPLPAEPKSTANGIQKKKR